MPSRSSSVSRRRYTFLTIDDVEQVVFELTAEFYSDYPDPLPAFQYIGGSHGRGLLESALLAPQQGVGGQYLARTIFDKAAILFRSLVKNHPMLDGNKRLALTTVTIFLWENGYVLAAAADEAVAFTVGIASTPGNPELRPISRWLRTNSIKFEKLLSATPAERQELAAAMRVSVTVLAQEIREIQRELGLLLEARR